MQSPPVGHVGGIPSTTTGSPLVTTSPRTQFASDTGGGDAGDWRSALGRVGLAARGVLYLVFGILAFHFALGDTSSSQVSDRGAIQYVQGQPFGTQLLWVLAIGLAALALWQLVTAVTGDPVKGSDPSDRAMYAFKAVAYGATAVTAFAALGVSGSGGGSGGGGGQSKATAFLLGLPFGQWIVGAIGLGVIGYALYTVYKNVLNTRFMRRIMTNQLDHDTTETVRAGGRWGYGARGTVIGLIGAGLVVAALQHSADQTRGLGGSLVVLARQSYGTWLLIATAIGLGLFGLFSMVEARYRVAA